MCYKTGFKPRGAAIKELCPIEKPAGRAGGSVVTSEKTEKAETKTGRENRPTKIERNGGKR